MLRLGLWYLTGSVLNPPVSIFGKAWKWLYQFWTRSGFGEIRRAAWVVSDGFPGGPQGFKNGTIRVRPGFLVYGPVIVYRSRQPEEQQQHMRIKEQFKQRRQGAFTL